MDTVLTVALVLALVFGSGGTSSLALGAVWWMWSGGDKSKVDFARTRITSAIISIIFAVITIGIIELLGLALVPGWTTEHPALWLVAAAAGTGPFLYLALTILLARIAFTRATRRFPRLRRSVTEPAAPPRPGVATLLRLWSRTAVHSVVAVADWFSSLSALGLYWAMRKVTRLAGLQLPAEERPDFIESQRHLLYNCRPQERARYLLSMLFGGVRMGMIRRRRLARIDAAVMRDAAVTAPRTRIPGAARH